MGIKFSPQRVMFNVEINLITTLTRLLKIYYATICRPIIYQTQLSVCQITNLLTCLGFKSTTSGQRPNFFLPSASTTELHSHINIFLVNLASDCSHFDPLKMYSLHVRLERARAPSERECMILTAAWTSVDDQSCVECNKTNISTTF